MKKIVLLSLILLLFVSQNINAMTPTESLQITVDKLIAIAANSDKDEEFKKNALTAIISSEVDLEAVSRRVVSKSWANASDEQQTQFKDLFLAIVVNTYFSLLKEYSDEKVLYLGEQLKKDKYAIVDTEIVSSTKKIPVRYRLLNTSNGWKIYDFIPEGISLVTSYKNNYSATLRKNGMAGLLEEMIKKELEKTEE